MQVPSERRPYKRLCRLAEGGMGFVDLALREEGRFRRLYAVKRLHPQHRPDAGLRAMFMDEARLAGLVRHPNVVSVHDVGEDEEGPFLVMDYVDGLSLAAIIRGLRPTEAPLPLALCVSVAAQVARGLHGAHEARTDDGASLSLVHRDVSPQNILVGFDGTVRVTDFGIAKALGNTNRTATGLLKGNVGYMSPEQLRFEEPDRRSDLFALGVVLYEALARRRLYRNDEGNAIARRILTEPPPDIQEVRADAPPELVELLFELLAKERDLRPESALSVADRLEAMRTYLDATEGHFDLAVFLESHFGEVHAKMTADVATAMAGASTLAPVSSPAQPAPARPWGRVAVAAALVLAGGVTALAMRPSGDRPAPIAAATPVSSAVKAAERGPAAPAPEPAPVAAVPEAPPSAAQPPRASRKPRPAERAPSPGDDPAAADGASPTTLIRLPRPEQSGTRKLEIPIATDWQ